MGQSYNTNAHQTNGNQFPSTKSQNNPSQNKKLEEDRLEASAVEGLLCLKSGTRQKTGNSFSSNNNNNSNNIDGICQELPESNYGDLCDLEEDEEESEFYCELPKSDKSDTGSEMNILLLPTNYDVINGMIASRKRAFGQDVLSQFSGVGWF